MIKLYNSLSRKIEEFKPVNPPNVGMYTCGPTVYDFASIGNFRTYMMADILIRVLQYNGFEVTYIMNITDVGHLTGDNLGDADIGEDRMEKSAKKEGKTAWEIAQFYTDVFFHDYKVINLTEPAEFVKATDHIKEQIALIKKLEAKGFTYATSDGIYFDTAQFPKYGKLSTLDEIKEGARVEANPEKRNPRDFALWKFSYPQGALSFANAQDGSVTRRHMEWKSPWGVGFPGWHIECSAMSMKYLGETFDIHTGGIDLLPIHHPNEIAQSEAATGKEFARYWVHGAFLLVNGQKMGKSLNNVYRIYDLEKEGFDPLALRYLYMQTHYRQEMNFTFPALESAQNALDHIRKLVSTWDKPKIGCAEFEQKFLDALNDDMNMPQALSVVWELIRSEYPTSAKAETLYKMDRVLGFNLYEASLMKADVAFDEVPEDVRSMINEREKLRREKRFNLSDQLRHKIRQSGYDVEDTKKGIKIIKL